MKIWLKNKQYDALDGMGWDESGREYGRPFNEHELEVFYYWFEFLKRSSRFTWSQRVKADFEDISIGSDGTLCDMPFDEWWQHHNRLFWRPRLLSVEVLPDHMLTHFNDEVVEEGSRIKLLALFLDQPRERLREKFERILREYDAGKDAKGRYIYDEAYESSPDEDEDRYVIYNRKNARYRPNTRLLRNALDVYDAYKQLENGTLTLKGKWQIEESVSINRAEGDELMFRKERAEQREKVERAGKLPIKEEIIRQTSVGNHQIQASTVARYKQYADQLIENVAKGVFPKHWKVSQSKESLKS